VLTNSMLASHTLITKYLLIALPKCEMLVDGGHNIMHICLVVRINKIRLLVRVWQVPFATGNIHEFTVRGPAEDSI
jgi:hypothetical protein